MRRAPPVTLNRGQSMPSYKIEFIGGGQPHREPVAIHCIDDAQAMDWASGLVGSHLGAEVLEGTRRVGWVTASEPTLNPSEAIAP